MKHFFDAFSSRFVFFWRFFILARGSKIKYLRSRGMIIGERCDLLNNIHDYGSEPFLIKIGSDVTITHGVILLTHDASTRLFRRKFSYLNPNFGNKFGTIQIEDNSFIGVNAIILPDVKIGPNAIVGAGSVVTKNVSPNSVVAGNPAKLICSLDEYIHKSTSSFIQFDSKDRVSFEKELQEKLLKVKL